MSNHFCIWNEVMGSWWGPFPREERKEGLESLSAGESPCGLEDLEAGALVFALRLAAHDQVCSVSRYSPFQDAEQESHLPADLGSFQVRLIQCPSLNSSQCSGTNTESVVRR